jgi:hypothetical protein
MTTLVLDDLSTPQRDVLAAMPIRDSCEGRAREDAGFAALFSSPGSPLSLHCANAAHHDVDRRPIDLDTEASTGAGA